MVSNRYIRVELGMLLIQDIKLGEGAAWSKVEVGNFVWTQPFLIFILIGE